MRKAQDPLSAFHPIVRTWFTETLGTPSAPQLAGWPAIAGGEHTLILAPTGTGKTLAAFLWELNALIVSGLEEPLPNTVHILYVSPLKALNNDMRFTPSQARSAVHTSRSRSSDSSARRALPAAHWPVGAAAPAG